MRHIAVTHPPRKSTSLSRRSFYAPRGILPCAIYYALRGLLCLARFIMLCVVYCALRGLLCRARIIMSCLEYCALRGLLCPARFIILCVVYCALRGLLCLARFIMLCAVYCALRGLLCRNVHICRGAPHYFYDRQNFLCAARLFVRREVTPRGFCTGGRTGLVRVMPICGYYPPSATMGAAKDAPGIKNPRGATYRRSAGEVMGIMVSVFHADGCGLFMPLRRLCRKLSLVFAYHAEERTYRRH